MSEVYLIITADFRCTNSKQVDHNHDHKRGQLILCTEVWPRQVYHLITIETVYLMLQSVILPRTYKLHSKQQDILNIQGCHTLDLAKVTLHADISLASLSLITPVFFWFFLLFFCF